MAGNKTVANNNSVIDFLNKIESEQKRKDCFQLLELMEAITGEKPVMWGDSIVGFGSYHYKYESGREGDMCLTGFSPRKTNLSLYFMTGFAKFETALEKLGKHKKGKSCLYIKKLEDIDEAILKEMLSDSVRHTIEKYSSE